MRRQPRLPETICDPNLVERYGGQSLWRWVWSGRRENQRLGRWRAKNRDEDRQAYGGKQREGAVHFFLGLYRTSLKNCSEVEAG
jgi:hypothetical protein